MLPLPLSQVMTLIRLIQRASILAGMTFAGLSVHSNPAQSDTPQFCVIASNGKTVCGILQVVERACIITDTNNTVCGKFKSVKPGQEQGQEASRPAQSTIARKEVDNFVFALKGCRRSESSVKCEFVITNKGAERSLLFNTNAASNIVDSSGKLYKGSTADIGGESGSYVARKITPGINYSASITFENIPEQLVKAELLELNIDYRPLQFRNIPILK
jgi:hypothetical protein